MTKAEYDKQLARYQGLVRGNGSLKPILNEDEKAYVVDGHYYYLGKWFFEKILKSMPVKHVDFGGQIELMGLISTITKVTHYDIRQPIINDPEIEFKVGNVTKTGLKANSIESLSCLHVAEHIGLGRYGDKLDPNGTVKACKELARILKPQGSLYFAVPVGIEQTVFNAHRILDPRKILEVFISSGLKLIELSASHVYAKPPTDETNHIRDIDTTGNLNATVNILDLSKCNYSCGMYYLTKS